MYQDRVRKDRSWEEIAQELLPDEWARYRSEKRMGLVKRLKTKWNSCRDQFRREFNANKVTVAMGNRKKKPYLYTKDLQFLLPIMDLRPTVDNLEAEGDSSTDIENPTPPPSCSTAAVEMEDVPRPDEESHQETSPQQPTQRPSKRRRGGSNPQAPSEMARRDYIDSQVFEYLNKNKSETPEEKKFSATPSVTSTFYQIWNPFLFHHTFTY
ncbi:uncharacterized protein LOC122930928 [Bufo gargarizans]|uniref:uncharacterized protein LOC122930928 n=1 Tax=Bufo gargarizans TaxID=30331 RepID=UPI001CF577C6|nr:uncharacterized protein LOC122930928 [Bufo gargarizans]